MRFVLLKHTMPATSNRATHWDFMLERGDVLRTWALDAEPCDGCEIAATALPDHRLEYLDYEGPVSGDRGFVERFDLGTCTLREADEIVQIELRGAKLIGTATLRREPGDAQRWRFTFAAAADRGDAPASP